ncbi:hypothetical protein ACOME3_001286 [Neoechinorhynchus agilis]
MTNRIVHGMFKNYLIDHIIHTPHISIMGLRQTVEALFVCLRTMNCDENKSEETIIDAFRKYVNQDQSKGDDLIKEYEKFKKLASCLDVVDVSRKYDVAIKINRMPPNVDPFTKIFLDKMVQQGHTNFHVQLDLIDSLNCNNEIFDAIVAYMQLMFNTSNQLAIAFCLSHSLKIKIEKEGIDFCSLMSEHCRKGLTNFLKVMDDLQLCLYEKSIEVAKCRLMKCFENIFPDQLNSVISILQNEIDECCSHFHGTDETIKIQRTFNATTQRLALLQSECSVETCLSQITSKTPVANAKARLYYKSPIIVKLSSDAAQEDEEICPSIQSTKMQLGVLSWTNRTNRPLIKKSTALKVKQHKAFQSANTSKRSNKEIQRKRKAVEIGQRSIKEFFTEVKRKHD